MRFRARVALPVVVLGLAASLANGCKPKKPPCQPASVEYAVHVLVQATAALNPGVDGEALPVTFRLYQLKDGSGLESLDFDLMWQDAGAALGSALVGEDEMTVFPGRTQEREIKADPGTTHLLAVAIYREHVGNTWYRVYEMPKYHGDYACAAQNKGKTLDDPCFQVLLDAYQVDGGPTSPPGFELTNFDVQCGPPPAKEPPAPPDDGKKKKKKKKKKKRKKRGLGKKAVDTAKDPPKTPSKPSKPSAPSKPSVPKGPGLSMVPASPEARAEMGR